MGSLVLNVQCHHLDYPGSSRGHLLCRETHTGKIRRSRRGGLTPAVVRFLNYENWCLVCGRIFCALIVCLAIKAVLAGLGLAEQQREAPAVVRRHLTALSA